MRATGVLTVLAASCGAASAQYGRCDTGNACIFSFPWGSSTVTYDLRGLCNPNQDYVISDNYGHTYYAQLCGSAAKSCLPLK